MSCGAVVIQLVGKSVPRQPWHPDGRPRSGRPGVEFPTSMSNNDLGKSPAEIAGSKPSRSRRPPEERERVVRLHYCPPIFTPCSHWERKGGPWGSNAVTLRTPVCRNADWGTGAVAHLAERLLGMQQAAGPNPASSTGTW